LVVKVSSYNAGVSVYTLPRWSVAMREDASV